MKKWKVYLVGASMPVEIIAASFSTDDGELMFYDSTVSYVASFANNEWRYVISDSEKTTTE